MLKYPQTNIQKLISRYTTPTDACRYSMGHLDLGSNWNWNNIVNPFDPQDAESIGLAQIIVASPRIKKELAYIKANFSCIPIALTQLQTRGSPLNEAIEKFYAVRPALRGIQNQDFLAKFEYVATKNSGLSVLREIGNAIHAGPAESDDSDVDGDTQFVKSLSPTELAAFKYAPVTSADVERSFSVYKNVLHEKRRKFMFENLKKHVIVHCNVFDWTSSGNKRIYYRFCSAGDDFQ